MLSALVVEIIVDPLLLHQAADKVIRRFPVLHAIIPLPIRAVKPLNDVSKAMILKDLLENFRNRHALKYPAVRRPRQKPEPRHQGGTVFGQPPLVFRLLKAADVAIEKTALLASLVHEDRHVLADDFFVVQLVIFTGQNKVIMKWPP